MNTINRYCAILTMAIVVMVSCQKKPAQEIVEVETPVMTESFEFLIGTYTGQGSEGIYSAQLLADSGAIADKKLLVKSEQPSYVIANADKSLVVAVNETENGAISTFRWNTDHTSLQLVSKLRSMGDYPCHVALSNDEKLAVLANYGTGNWVGYRIDAQGAMDSAAIIKQHAGTGGNPERQEGPHAHYGTFSANGKFLYAVDLGIDKVMAYPVLADSLGEGSIALALDAGDGPRHLAFHPSLDIVYVINELTSSIVVAKVDTVSGNFEPINKVSTLPDGFDGTSYCAAIKVSTDGQYLYASNRGHNSIAVFAVDEAGGLTLKGTESVQGDWPRDFALSPDQKFILIANQKSDNIVVLNRDTETGMLSYAGQQLAISQPVCVKF